MGYKSGHKVQMIAKRFFSAYDKAEAAVIEDNIPTKWYVNLSCDKQAGVRRRRIAVVISK